MSWSSSPHVCGAHSSMSAQFVACAAHSCLVNIAQRVRYVHFTQLVMASISRFHHGFFFCAKVQPQTFFWPVHNHIRSDNLVFTKDGKIKLTEIGSIGCKTADQVFKRGSNGTPYWYVFFSLANDGFFLDYGTFFRFFIFGWFNLYRLSPEFIRQGELSTTTDVWSLGIFLIGMNFRLREGQISRKSSICQIAIY